MQRFIYFCLSTVTLVSCEQSLLPVFTLNQLCLIDESRQVFPAPVSQIWLQHMRTLLC